MATAGLAKPARGDTCCAAQANSSSMLLFLPVAILLVTLLALSLSNLQRGFRSNWLLALGGSLLAWVSLLFLRLQLPLHSSFSFWWVGEGLEYSATFVLDDVSWPLAFAVSSMLVALLLGRVREAMTAPWFAWAPTLAIGAASLLTLPAGDPLTFLFTWTFLDVLGFVFLLFEPKSGEERQKVVQKLAISLLGMGLLFAAWMFAFYGQELTNTLIFLSTTLRLGLWAPYLRMGSYSGLHQSASSLLLLAPSLVLLARSGTMAEPMRSTLLLLTLLPAAYAAGNWVLNTSANRPSFWDLGMAALVAAAALGGHGQTAVAFSLVLLLGQGMLLPVQHASRFRVVMAVLVLLLLSGFPYTAGYWGGKIYVNWASPLVFTFLAIQAAMLAGWLRRALEPSLEPLSPETWMRTIQWLGLTLVPLAFIFLGLGLLPSFAPQAPIPWWPALVVLAGSAIFFFLARLRRPTLASRIQLALDWLFSLRWLKLVGNLLSRMLSWGLSFFNGLLEGPAGVLWALLFVAILLSLAAQYGMGS